MSADDAASGYRCACGEWVATEGVGSSAGRWHAVLCDAAETGADAAESLAAGRWELRCPTGGCSMSLAGTLAQVIDPWWAKSCDCGHRPALVSPDGRAPLVWALSAERVAVQYLGESVRFEIDVGPLGAG